MTDKLKSQYFESDENGNYIGYHIEGGETFKNVGEVSLTKMNIDGTRPLFLCNNPKEWYPEHLPNNKDTYKVLKVVFKPIKEHVVPKAKDFNKLLLTERFDLQQQEVTQHYASKEMEKLLDDKIDLVILSPDNDKKELSEAMLFNAKFHIVDISVV